MSTAVDGVRGEEAVKSALADATADLLAELGPRALSLREVARRAGVNHGQVHHYFGSKRSLLVAGMRKLALEHYRIMMERSGGTPISPALSIAEDRRYWRAVCHVVMEGDLELARVEIDEGVSGPRHALEFIRERRGISPDDLDFKARFAAVVALQLGWAALEEFVFLVADVRDEDRDEVRERVRELVADFDRN